MAVSQNEKQKCPVCNHTTNQYEGKYPLNLLYFVDCPQCGEYEIQDRLNPFSTDKAYLISAWIREQNEREKAPKINYSDSERL